MPRPRIALAAVLLAVVCIPVANAQRSSLDEVLAGYASGDYDIVRRTFVRSPDVQDRLRLTRPRELDRWLGSWNRSKAMLLLDVARTSTTIAPQYVAMILGAGRRYVAQSPADFAQPWFRAAAAVLQEGGDPAHVEAHVMSLSSVGSAPDPRLVLAYAVAQERRCWMERPSLDQPALGIDGLLDSADSRVADDPHSAPRSLRDDVVRLHRGCLREAISRFEVAARLPAVAAESRARGAWTLFQDGRADEALAWLEAAKPEDDRDLEYWHALFRGRVLDRLGRSEDAVRWYRSALVLSPRAQSAGVGLALALMHLDRTSEADEVSRLVRGGAAATPDPWLHYPRGDARFAARWIEALRAAAR